MLQSRVLPLLATILFASVTTALPRNGMPDGEGTNTIDGVPINQIPTGGSARAFALVANDRTGWTATADSYQAGNEPQRVLDGDTGTLWHTQYTPNSPHPPHYITIDMKSARYVSGLTYQPRSDNNANGNIGEHTIQTSLDGNNFGPNLATGTYRSDAELKTTVFAATNARYVRLTALTEANGNAWSSAAEINILSANGPPPSGGGVGSWGPTIDMPLVPVSGALDHDTGKVIVWSSYQASTFTGGNGGFTVTATFDPGSGIVTQRTVTNTQHDMFCPGLSLDFHGRPTVTGGNDNQRLSIYDSGPDNWISGPNMITGRGYQAQTTISDGRTFVIGGSWSGGQGNKNGEIYNPSTNSWQALPGCPVAPMLTNDQQGVYRADNHGWLFAWKGGSVFQAGPSKNMNWYGTDGAGSQHGAGTRAADTDSMNGNAVMYDALNGKILTLGGALNYQTGQATFNAHVITLGAPYTNPAVTRINDMYFQRSFANSVVLPDGQVLVIGGQVVPQPFSDDTAQLTGELWNPNGFHFVKIAPMPIPRTYHSIALLLLDGTVLSAGGGLCGDGCATNHYDGLIYYPPYLYNNDGSKATRPQITGVSIYEVHVGGTFTATTNTAVTWSLIRYSSTTHTVNTDQRRIALFPSNNGNTYNFQLPNDPGILLPGFWMLFALSPQGVPSIARTMHVNP